MASAVRGEGGVVVELVVVCKYLGIYKNGEEEEVLVGSPRTKKDSLRDGNCNWLPQHYLCFNQHIACQETGKDI